MNDNRAVVTELVDVLDSTEPEDTPVENVLVEDVLVEDVLVEEVSIDGMCGVY